MDGGAAGVGALDAGAPAGPCRALGTVMPSIVDAGRPVVAVVAPVPLVADPFWRFRPRPLSSAHLPPGGRGGVNPKLPTSCLRTIIARPYPQRERGSTLCSTPYP